MSKKKLTPDVIAVGALSFAGSIATQKILLAPKQTVTVAGNIKIPVQGLIPFSQKYVAVASKEWFNTLLPMSLRGVDSIFTKLDVKRRIQDFVLWFFYDFLNRYSLNMLISKVLLRSDFFDKETYKNVLRDLINRMLNEKADRDAMIQNITKEIVYILRSLSEGTLLAVVFNDKFATALSGTIAAAIDRFMNNEAASKVTDFLFNMVGHLEDMTFTYVLIHVFGIKRDDMAGYIDNFYDSVLGSKMIDSLESLRLGDVAYELISAINYDDLYKVMHEELQNDMLRVNITAAATSVYFYREAVDFTDRVRKRLGRVTKVKNAVKSIGHRKSDKKADLAE